VVVEHPVLAADGAAVTAWKALARGIGLLQRHKRLWFVFYGATTLAALLITAPVIAVAMHSLGGSVWAREMTGNLDISWFSEMYAQYRGLPMSMLGVLVAGVGAISLVVYLFFLGGALQVLCTDGSFLAGCGRNFWRIVRLSLISAAFYGAALFVANRVNAVGPRMWGEGSVETPLVYWGWLHATVLVCLAGYVNLVFDYARVRLVAEDQRGAWRAAFASFGFVWRYRGKTVPLYCLVCAIAGLCFAAYLGISHVTPQSSMMTVLLLLAIRQAMVLAKTWSRLLFCSTAWEMYSALRPAPVPESAPPEPEPETPPEPMVEVALPAEIAVNAFQFITAWNQTPECRAHAEARLPGLAGVSGVIFDPSRLTGHLVILSRVADDLQSPLLDELIRSALAFQGVDRPVTMVEGMRDNGVRRVMVSMDAP
jgi:hypothetical protein